MNARLLARLTIASSICAIAAAGGAALSASPDAGALTAASSTLPELGGIICHSTPGAAALRMRLAATEVPKAEMQAAVPAPEFADTDPPLWSGLGNVSYKITTSNAEAQAYFDQGLRLAYAFNHAEAQRAFRKAQKLDPSCAMCFWGEALVLGPNINLPMQDDAVAPAFAAVEKARALASKASPREQALIAALATRYAKDAKIGRAHV